MTAQIPLAADLVPLILNGQKTSTVRLGIRDYPLGPARIVSGEFNVPIEITQVEFTKLGHLNAHVAKSEGYQSLSELLAALKRFYPEAGNDRDVTIIHFRQI